MRTQVLEPPGIPVLLFAVTPDLLALEVVVSERNLCIKTNTFKLDLWLVLTTWTRKKKLLEEKK